MGRRRLSGEAPHKFRPAGCVLVAWPLTKQDSEQKFKMLSILRKARLKDKEMRILMLYV